jgi:GNAT superfamily N-acetyltransferase
MHTPAQTESQPQVHYRQAVEADLAQVARMYDKLDALLRQHTYTFPLVEKPGDLWLEMFRRTLGRFSVLYVAEIGPAGSAPDPAAGEMELVGFIVARVKRVPEYLGGVMVGELKDMWVEHEVRRLGIGEQLLRLAIEWCRDQGVYSVEAQILAGNQPIIQLVERLGMKKELYQMRMLWQDYQPQTPPEE